MVGVRVEVAVLVGVPVEVAAGVFDGVLVAVDVLVGVGVLVGVLVGRGKQEPVALRLTTANTEVEYVTVRVALPATPEKLSFFPVPKLNEAVTGDFPGSLNV